MRNYEYIIASLPVISAGQTSKTDADDIITFLKEQLDARDQALLEQLLDAFQADKLDASYYKEALKSRNSFIRGFISYDLLLRNLKVEYLNQQLERPAEQDLMLLNDNSDEVDSTIVPDCQEPAAEQIRTALRQSDILARERKLDDLLWSAIEELNKGELFSLNAILGFVAQLKIVDRWQQLDPQTGRELLRKAIESIRSTYDNKKTNII